MTASKVKLSVCDSRAFPKLHVDPFDIVPELLVAPLKESAKAIPPDIRELVNYIFRRHPNSPVE